MSGRHRKPREDGLGERRSEQTPVDGQSRLRPGHPAMAAGSPHRLAESVDDSRDNTVGSRCPRSDLPSRGKMEAAKTPGKEPAKVKEGEPERGGVRPAARRRRGRPRKADRPPAGEQGIAGAAAEAGVLPEVGDLIPTTRRGQPRDRGPRRQRDRTALLSRSPPIGGVYGLQQAFFIERDLRSIRDT